MFPALLVIMALTGAFYPAIDLGAGEKERGTMETLLISPARRIELVLGKFATIMLFSVATAVLNLFSMGLTGQQMASGIGRGVADTISLEFPGFVPLMWMVILLLPLSALFSSLCLALATFARSTKEGQYYLTPLLMIVMGLTMFCLSPAVEMTPLYSVLPVVNVTLLLKGLLLNAPGSGNLVVFAVPVLISSIGYSMLSLWWAIELYNSEDVLFREAEKFDLRLWFRQMLRTKDAVPAFPEAVFCFILILMLQFVAMKYMATDLSAPDPGQQHDAFDRRTTAGHDRLSGRLYGPVAHDQSARHVSPANAVTDRDGHRGGPCSGRSSPEYGTESVSCRASGVSGPSGVCSSGHGTDEDRRSSDLAAAARVRRHSRDL